jgi:hypothetical protein
MWELLSTEYIEIDDKHKTVSIFFSEERDFVKELSADQDFGENRILLAESGVYAIVVNITLLNDMEKRSIQRFVNNGPTPHVKTSI